MEDCFYFLEVSPECPHSFYQNPRPNLVPYSCDKIQITSYCWRSGSHFQDPVYRRGKPQRAQTGGARSLLGMLPTGLLPASCFACFFIFPRTVCSRVAQPTVDWALWYQTLMEKMPHRHAQSPILQKQFLNWSPFSQVSLVCAMLTKTKQNNLWKNSWFLHAFLTMLLALFRCHEFSSIIITAAVFACYQSRALVLVIEKLRSQHIPGTAQTGI